MPAHARAAAHTSFRRTVLAFGLLTGAALALSGCASDDPGVAEINEADSLVTAAGPQTSGTAPRTRQAQTSGPASVALLVPLSGQHSDIGQQLVDGVNLAIQEGGGSSITLATYDTQGTPGGAEAAAQTALADGAQMILGPLFAHSVKAVQPVAAPQGVPVVGFSNDPTVAGNGAFTMGTDPVQQTRRIAGVAARNGMERIALVGADNDYVRLIDATLRQMHNEGSIRYVDVSLYPEGASYDAIARTIRQVSDYDDRKQALADLKARIAEQGADAAGVDAAVASRIDTLHTWGDPGFDAVLLPVGGETLLTVAPAFELYDVVPDQARLLGTEMWETVGGNVVKAMHGGWYVTPGSEMEDDYMRRHNAQYGYRPNRLAWYAYDAAAAAIALARANEPFTIANLTRSTGFPGAAGVFRLGDDGRVRRGLAVLEIGPNGQRRVIAPADATLASAAF